VCRVLIAHDGNHLAIVHDIKEWKVPGNPDQDFITAITFAETTSIAVMAVAVITAFTGFIVYISFLVKFRLETLSILDRR